MVFKPIGSTSYDEVKTLHRDSDVDESPIAQHHTLGILPNQAAHGDHVHDGKSSRKVSVKDLQGVGIVYIPVVSTGGTQPTFSGDPLVTGSYTKIGNICFFQIRFDFSNVSTFGTGQYRLNLPFASQHEQVLRQGFLKDASASRRYAVSGHVLADSAQLLLHTVASNGLDEDFTSSAPTALATADSFSISGTYEIMV